MLRIAVIFESSPFDRKGLFNAVHNRIRHLLATGECEVDAYCIHSRDNALTRRLRHTPEVPETDEVTVEDIRYRILWYDFSITDHILLHKLRTRPLFFPRFVRTCTELLDGYDCIMAHSFTGGLIARAASALYDTPYFISWHGSDIHTHPWRNPLILKETRALMEGAECNFFVSAALKAEACRISPDATKEILYNGVSADFRRMPDEQRRALRKSYLVGDEDKVVAFAGNLVAVKNVHCLPPLFNAIRADYKGKLKFWIIGDGKLRSSVEKEVLEERNIDVRFWGNMPAAEMPSLMNCIDLLILPSINEGLPLVCAEAISCGASVIGSDVGGIPEVIGKEQTAPHGEYFIKEMASKAVAALINPPIQIIPLELDWNSTAAKELAAIRKVLQSE